MNEATMLQPAEVALSIPCRAEYVGVARLAILGVASRLNFSYDEVEDLRLAVGEACTAAIDRCSNDGADAAIRITCSIRSDELNVSVNYKSAGPPPRLLADTLPAPADAENIGALLMEILVDSVVVQESPEAGTTVRLCKRVRPE